jgi:hypothetical protein
MAEKSFPLENTLYNAEDAQLWMSTRTTGLYSAEDNLAVKPAGGMQILVAPGLAWLNWAKFKGIVYANTEDKLLTVATAHGSLSRIDRVVVCYDQVLNTAELKILQGQPASAPVPPDIERAEGLAYEIALADIRVGRGVLEVTPADVTDQRLNEELCGIMRDGVTRIPTQELYDQVTDQWSFFLNSSRTGFDTWFETIKDILDENAAGNLLGVINKMRAELPSLSGWADFIRNGVDLDILGNIGKGMN